MKHIFHILFVCLFFAAAVCAQNPSPAPRTTASASNAKRGPIFRATKAQIVTAQNMLRSKRLYSGDANGKLDEPTRAAIKSYQKDNGLRATGSLNRATLEKMGIELTESQKAIPVSESSYAKAASGSAKPRGPVFRATKEQVIGAQKRLKAGGFYSGEETGKLDDPTRDGLKKYQEANGLRVTGTLNQVTLEKMGIALTDRQKESGGI